MNRSIRVLHGPLVAALLLAATTTDADAQMQAGRAWTDPSPHHARHVSVAPDVQLEVLDWGGTGPALVFLGGLGSTAHVFDDFAPRFRDKFHVYAITRRGFGVSSAPVDGYDAVTRARDIVTVLDSLGIDRAIFAGHSIAGDELSKVGASHPTRVRALVYLEAYDYAPARLAALNTLPAPAMSPMLAADSASVSAGMAYARRTFGVAVPEGEMRAQSVYAPDGRLVADRTDTGAGAKVWGGCAAAEFTRIAAPVLAIFAVRSGPAAAIPDYAVRDSANRAVVDRYYAAFLAFQKAEMDDYRVKLRNSTVLEIRDANHAIYLSNPDEVERVMRVFLAQQG